MLTLWPQAACRWLSTFLRTSGGTVVIVSHDEALLECCSSIVEVRGGKLHTFTGNYSTFLAARKLKEEQAIAAANAAAAEIARTEAFVAKFGAKTAFANAAKSREKMLDRMKAAAGELPAAASGAGGGDATKSRMYFPTPPPCHREVIILKDAKVGWSGKELLSKLTLTVEKGQRILVLGPNGAGKSTLLKSIAGTSPLLGGSRKLGEGAKVGVFAQDLAQELPLEKGALDYVLEKAREEDSSITDEQGRRALGTLGLGGDSVRRPIGQLSGGEKARVALAAFSLIPSNVLLLDEPSNHLGKFPDFELGSARADAIPSDAATIDALTAALQVYPGAIVAITHNKLFAHGLAATHVLRVEGGRASLKPNLLGALSDADFEDGKAAGPAAGVPRKTPKKERPPSEEELAEAAREAARIARYEAAGNADALAEASSKPKSKNEREAAKRAAEQAAKAQKAADKARGKKG